jgi:hypothetical protein
MITCFFVICILANMAALLNMRWHLPLTIRDIVTSANLIAIGLLAMFGMLYMMHVF